MEPRRSPPDRGDLPPAQREHDEPGAAHLDNPEQAWVSGWSGQGRVRPWEGQLFSDSHAFSGWSMWDFEVSPDGRYKLFVGRNGNAWFSDSPWRPIDDSSFSNQAVSGWDQPPYNGGSSDYLNEASWRPGTCEGLVVGDATSNMGMLLRFWLQES